MPVRAARLRTYLSYYDEQEREFLYLGFELGFSIPIQGPRISRLTCDQVSTTSNP